MDESYDLYQPPRSASETSKDSPMSLGNSSAYSRTYSGKSTFSDSPVDDKNSYCSDPSPSRWPAPKSKCSDKASDSELETMKERFAKLLLGEDMSGGGKGVCTAITISNSITNLYATVFGQSLRLAPLNTEKRVMWKREIDCLLSVCDFIVEFIPSHSQNLLNGTTLEVMESRRRADIYVNLPALRKLDAMLIEILDSFHDTEFWYAEQGSVSSSTDSSSSSTSTTCLGSFRRVTVQRKEDKWWLPVPCVPAGGGLSEKSRKHLRHKRDCSNQIHKAAMAINTSVLAEMEIPESYVASLPKSGKASLGDSIYNYMCKDKFSPEHLLNGLKITSEHVAVNLADRVEASMYTWRRKACTNNSKSSWDMVKGVMSEIDRNDKNHVLAERAETLLFCLKQRYPELAQTTLDTCKIEYNRDVGQAILESYSRVLEGLAFNIVAWIDDVLYVDTTMMRNQERHELQMSA